MSVLLDFYIYLFIGDLCKATYNGDSTINQSLEHRGVEGFLQGPSTDIICERLPVPEL